MSLNRVMLIGRLCSDPEMSYTPGGHQVTPLRLATNRTLTSQDGNRREESEFHDIVVWGKAAEAVAQHTRKGAQVYIEGRLQTRSWEQDGMKRYKTEVVAEQVRFLGRARELEPELRQEQTVAQ